MNDILINIWMISLFVVVLPIIMLNNHRLLKKTEGGSGFGKLINPFAAIKVDKTKLESSDRAFIWLTILIVVCWFIFPIAFKFI